MSARDDFIKILEECGGRRDESGGRHILWRIGGRLFPIPTVFTGHKFQNYVAQVHRISREEGLIPQRSGPKELPLGRKKKRRHARSNSSSAPEVEEATPEEIQEWQLRNMLEEFARKRELMKGAKMTEMIEKKHPLTEADRVPLIDRAMREAGEPLSAKEICSKIPGWENNDNDSRMTRNILRKNPARYRPTRGKKNNERYELVSQTPASAASTAAASGTSAAIVPEGESAASLREKPAGDADRVLQLIQMALADFKPESDPKEAVYILGQIRGLLRLL